MDERTLSICILCFLEWFLRSLDQMACACMSNNRKSSSFLCYCFCLLSCQLSRECINSSKDGRLVVSIFSLLIVKAELKLLSLSQLNGDMRMYLGLTFMVGFCLRYFMKLELLSSSSDPRKEHQLYSFFYVLAKLVF